MAKTPKAPKAPKAPKTPKAKVPVKEQASHTCSCGLTKNVDGNCDGSHAVK